MFNHFDNEGTFRLDQECSGLHPSGVFTREWYDKYRPTVAFLGIHERYQVLLVKSCKQSGEKDRPSWTLPQGGIEWGRTIPAALACELQEELGLPYSHARLQELWASDRLVMIGGYVNTRRGEEKPKYIVTVAMPISKPGRIILNLSENAAFELASNQQELRQLLADTRPVKQLGIYHAINEAHRQKMIDWSCDDVLREIGQSGDLVQAA